MAFCKYCGAEIPDGGVCSCPQAQAEAAGNSPQAPVAEVQPVAAPAVQPAAPAVQPAAPAVQAVPAAAPAANYFGEAFKQFVKLFTKPTSLVKDSIEGKISFEASIVLAGLYGVVVWIMNMITGFVVGAGWESILWSLLATVVICGFRFGTAALFMLFGKKKGLTYKKSLLTCFVTTIPATICWLLYGTFGLIGAGTRSFLFIMTLLIVLVFYAAIIDAYVENKDLALLFTIAIICVLMIGYLLMNAYENLIFDRAMDHMSARTMNALEDLYSGFLGSLF